MATLLSSCLWSNNNLVEVWTEEAPQVIGPYSQAVQAGEYLFISGLLAINPSTNKLTGDTIEEQTAQVLNNIESILRWQGLAFKDVVKTEVYLKI